MRETESGGFEFDTDGPVTTRASVKFSNWDQPGMVIQGEKLKADAHLFKRAASAISAPVANPDDNARAIAAVLVTMAQQYEDAAAGRHPQARV